jgi:hypothetical protein
MFDFFVARNAFVAVEPIVHSTPQECEYCSPVERRCTIPLFHEEGDDVNCGVFIIYCFLKDLLT